MLPLLPARHVTAGHGVTIPRHGRRTRRRKRAGHERNSETEWSRAVRLLQDANKIALACDVTADGDALGCLLAAALALHKQGRRTVASWGRTPFEVPRTLAALPGQELLVPPARFPRTPGLLVTFAAPDATRLGQLAGAAERAEGVIVVDDHDSNTLFGNVHLVDPDIEATVVIVDELLRRLGVPLSAEIAAPLYAGLSADTGSFRYRVTSAATHELAARLLRTGFRHDLLARAMWDTHAVGYLRAARFDALAPGRRARGRWRPRTGLDVLHGRGGGD